MLGGWEFQLLEWAGKCCLMCTGPARCCSKQVYGMLLYISGPSGPLFPPLPSLWHDLRMSGKERHLVPLWDKL